MDDDAVLHSLPLDGEIDEEEDLEHEKDDDRHKSLLKDISTITGGSVKQVKRKLRSEPSSQVSEHLWSSGNDSSNKVQLHELVSSLQQSSSMGSLKKKLDKLEKSSKVLDAPLPKPQVERIQRTINYENTAKEISKWSSTIIKNREAETLSFPLNAYQPPDITTKNLAANFKPRNPLEKEIAAVLKGSSHVLERKNKELTEDEEKALQLLDLEEALERRKELQRLRVLQSYYETKCKRAKKIKSKKYHRLMRKAEKKAIEKVNIADLAKNNPELYKSEVDNAEKLRALERANLRHRNTSKWAKNLITKGHKSTEIKDALTEQLRVSRELTEQKTQHNDDDEEEPESEKQEEEQNDDLKLLSKTDDQKDNPWLLGHNGNQSEDNNRKTEKLKKLQPLQNVNFGADDNAASSDEGAFNSGDEWDTAAIDDKKKEQTEKEAKKGKKKENKGSKGTSNNKSRSINIQDEVTENLGKTSKVEKSKKSKKKKEEMKKLKKQIKIIDEEESSESDKGYEGIVDEGSDDEQNEKQPQQLIDYVYDIGDETKNRTVEVNPNHFLRSETNAVELTLHGDESEDEDDEQLMNIREAFANDDVVEEFEAEKEDIRKKGKPKDIDLSLPGWGDWGGVGIKMSEKKKQTFIIKAPEAKKRKDDKMQHIIISEDRNRKFSRYQVSDVPFPFTSRSQYERSIRQPVGPKWNTPSVTTKLIQPRVSTLMGTIIDPIKPTKELKRQSKDTKDKKSKKSRS